MDVLTAEMELTPPGSRRVGVASVLVPRWNYGKLGRAIDGQNRLLGRNRGGVQIVGTQAACERGKRRGIHGIPKQAKRLFGQYRQAKRKRRGLALQISFSSSPEADGNLPVERIPPALAGKCTSKALRRGAGAILFWASPESMASLFEVGRVARLRGP